MLSQCTLAQSIEEAISAENSAISVFLSLSIFESQFFAR